MIYVKVISKWKKKFALFPTVIASWKNGEYTYNQMLWLGFYETMNDYSNKDWVYRYIRRCGNTSPGYKYDEDYLGGW